MCLAILGEQSMTPTKLLHLLFTTHDENQNIASIILLVASCYLLGARGHNHRHGAVDTARVSTFKSVVNS